MARITRRKAAEILGLSRQTISNYIEQGLIGSCVGEHGILYCNHNKYCLLRCCACKVVVNNINITAIHFSVGNLYEVKDNISTILV